MLINKTWKELYIEMQASPLETITDKQFSEIYNVNYNTLEAWKRDNRKQIFDEVDRRRKDFLKQARSIAYKELIKKLSKDTNALKLFFQLSGDLVERSENRTEVMTPADLKRGINEMMNEILNKEKTWGGEEGVAQGKTPTSADVPVSPNEQVNEPGKDFPSNGTV